MILATAFSLLQFVQHFSCVYPVYYGLLGFISVSMATTCHVCLPQTHLLLGFSYVHPVLTTNSLKHDCFIPPLPILARNSSTVRDSVASVAWFVTVFIKKKHDEQRSSTAKRHPYYLSLPVIRLQRTKNNQNNINYKKNNNV